MRAVFYPVIPKHMPGVASVIDLWALKCDHGLVTSDDVHEAFSPELILNRLVADRMQLPAGASHLMTALVAIRSLMGLLLTTRFGCSCGVTPLPLAELDPEADRGRLS